LRDAKKFQVELSFYGNVWAIKVQSGNLSNY